MTRRDIYTKPFATAAFVCRAIAARALVSKPYRSQEFPSARYFPYEVLVCIRSSLNTAKRIYAHKNAENFPRLRNCANVCLSLCASDRGNAEKAPESQRTAKSPLLSRAFHSIYIKSPKTRFAKTRSAHQQRIHIPTHIKSGAHRSFPRERTKRRKSTSQSSLSLYISPRLRASRNSFSLSFSARLSFFPEAIARGYYSRCGGGLYARKMYYGTRNLARSRAHSRCDFALRGGIWDRARERRRPREASPVVSFYSRRLAIYSRA